MKDQKGFIQIPLLIAILIASVSVASVGAGVVLHKQGKLTPLIANVSEVFKNVKNTREEIKKIETDITSDITSTIETEERKELKLQEEIKKQEKLRQQLKEEAEVKAQQELQQQLESQKLAEKQRRQEELRRQEEAQKLADEKAKKEAEERRWQEEIEKDEAELKKIEAELKKLEEQIVQEEMQAVGSISLELTPSIIEADGKSQFTVEAKVKNINGYLIPNKKVNFKLLKKSQEILSTNELTNAEGFVSKTYITGTIPERLTITASVDDVNKSVYLDCFLVGTEAVKVYADELVVKYYPVWRNAKDLFIECIDYNNETFNMLTREEIFAWDWDLNLCYQSIAKGKEAQTIFNNIFTPKVMEKFKEFSNKEMDHRTDAHKKWTDMAKDKNLNQYQIDSINDEIDFLKKQSDFYKFQAAKELKRYSEQNF